MYPLLYRTPNLTTKKLVKQYLLTYEINFLNQYQIDFLCGSIYCFAGIALKGRGEVVTIADPHVIEAFLNPVCNLFSMMHIASRELQEHPDQFYVMISTWICMSADPEKVREVFEESFSRATAHKEKPPVEGLIVLQNKTTSEFNAYLKGVLGKKNLGWLNNEELFSVLSGAVSFIVDHMSQEKIEKGVIVSTIETLLKSIKTLWPSLIEQSKMNELETLTAFLMEWQMAIIGDNEFQAIYEEFKRAQSAQ